MDREPLELSLVLQGDVLEQLEDLAAARAAQDRGPVLAPAVVLLPGIAVEALTRGLEDLHRMECPPLESKPGRWPVRCTACGWRGVNPRRGGCPDCGERALVTDMRGDHRDPAERVAELARTFPTMEGADGADPFDAERLAAWLKGPAPGSGARWAGLFLLSVWNTDAPADLGLPSFDAIRALASWDDKHRRAFLAWAARPWWA